MGKRQKIEVTCSELEHNRAHFVRFPAHRNHRSSLSVVQSLKTIVLCHFSSVLADDGVGVI